MKVIKLIEKIPWKVIIIILLATIFSFGSINYLQKWMVANQDSVMVPVPTHRIYPNQVIQKSDLMEKKILKVAVENTTVINPEEIAGMVTLTDLFPGEPIWRDKLVTPETALNAGEALVTIKAENLEQVLGGNIRPNMIVDVLYTNGPEKPPVLLAESAKVIMVLGEDGKALDAPLLPGAQPRTPKMVTLKVKSQEIYEFTRPLNGGFAMLAQVGQKKLMFEEQNITQEIPPETSPENPEPEDMVQPF